MDTELELRLNRLEQLALLAAKNVFTVEDVAVLIGKSVKTVRNLVSTNSIPCYRNEHGTFFKRQEIEDWQCDVQRTLIPKQL